MDLILKEFILFKKHSALVIRINQAKTIIFSSSFQQMTSMSIQTAPKKVAVNM